MKGIISTEFLEMAEAEFGIQTVDKITSLVELHDQGAYTAVGNYPHGDMIAMLGALSKEAGLEQTDLLTAYGRYLFKTFTREYSAFFKNISSSQEFLNGIETVIHSEVRKLYPDANLPSFDCSVGENRTLTLDYESHRPLADLAEGLIKECIEHFGDPIELIREPGPSKDAHSARFILVPSRLLQ